MRPYANNSPQAVARLLALSMLIDGVADEVEYEMLEHHGVLDGLGLSRIEIDAVIQDIYEDLDLGVAMARTLDQRLTAGDLSRLVAEVTEPSVRQLVLRGMMRIAVANDEISAGEGRLIREALLQWLDDSGVGSLGHPAEIPCRRRSDRHQSAPANH